MGKDPYIVLRIPNPDVPVYEVQKESGKGPVKTLHRNLLLPFMSIPCVDTEEAVQSPSQTMEKTPRRKTRQTSAVSAESDSESDSSCSETDSQRYVIPARRKMGYRSPRKSMLPPATSPTNSSRVDSVNSERIPSSRTGNNTSMDRSSASNSGTAHASRASSTTVPPSPIISPAEVSIAARIQ